MRRRRGGGQGRLRVGLGGDRSLFAKTLQVELSPPIARAADIVVEFTASPIGLQSLFPTVTGAIEMNPTGASGTQLVVYVRYRPPLGTFGKAVDRSLAQRLAQLVLHALLEEVAASPLLRCHCRPLVPPRAVDGRHRRWRNRVSSGRPPVER